MVPGEAFALGDVVALGKAAGEVATEALGEAIAVATGDAVTPGEAAAFTWPDTPVCVPCVPYVPVVVVPLTPTPTPTPGATP